MKDDSKKLKTDPETKTLNSDDIVTEAKSPLSRRAMLGAIGGAAALAIPGCVPRRARVVVGAPPPPQGTVVVTTGGGRVQTGVTDSDGGPYADPAGYGRGAVRGAYTGVTDSDGGPYADPAGQGRGVYGQTSGVTDSDGGPYADPAGNGRGNVRLGYTGITDSDGGPYADPAGHGRGRWR